MDVGGEGGDSFLYFYSSDIVLWGSNNLDESKWQYLVPLLTGVKFNIVRIAKP